MVFKRKRYIQYHSDNRYIVLKEQKVVYLKMMGLLNTRFGLDLKHREIESNQKVVYFKGYQQINEVELNQLEDKGWFEDDELQNFYQNTIDLKDYVPMIYLNNGRLQQKEFTEIFDVFDLIYQLVIYQPVARETHNPGLKFV